MNKNYLFKLLSALVLLLSILLYLLVEFKVFKTNVKHKFGLFFLFLMLGFGLLNLINGAVNKSKSLYLSALFLSGALIYLSIVFLKLKPLVLIASCAALFAFMHLVYVFLSKAVSSITADNEKEGYKSYAERKQDTNNRND